MSEGTRVRVMVRIKVRVRAILIFRRIAEMTPPRNREIMYRYI